MSLLNVGVENTEPKNATTEVLDTEVAFGAFEAGIIEPDELVVGYERLLNTADVLEETIETDRLGAESNAVTEDSIQRQLSELHNVLDLGIDESKEVRIGKEDKVVDTLLLGVEAKEGMIKEIIRKAKDFIKMIVNSIKKYATKIVVATKTLFMNISKLKDLAEDNEDDFKLDAKEDAKIHNKFRDIIGYFHNSSPITAVTNLTANIEDVYKESTKSGADESLRIINGGQMFLEKYWDAAANRRSLDGLGSLPSTSSVRTIFEKKLIGVADIVYSPNTIYVVGLSKTGTGKKEKWKSNYAHSPVSVKAITYTGTITASEIKDVATSVTSYFDRFPIQEVVNAVYERLDITSKYISEDTKASKKQTVAKMMKYASYTQKLGAVSIKAMVSTQKSCYSVLKLLVTEAGN